ncbi:MAG TPA: hypothetical protein VHZ04_01830 [Candidatus Paceibacterota bacterium]|nr:hypothetical protein [Candidatus Paceibacterota bacterium]
MNYSKTAFIGALFAAFFLAVGVLAAPLAQAQTVAQAATPTCTITQDDLAAIAAAQAQSLTAELAARKALLTRIITCAEENVQALQTDLAGVQTNAATAALQSQLSGKLDDAMNYYGLEFAKVNNAGIAGTEGVANEILAWRAGTYDPLADQVANFVLWSENQNLFTTAQNRLGEVQNLVSFMEQAAPNPDLAQDLTSAQSLITTAVQENNSAENALMQSEPSEATLSLITSSLQSLSDAYQKFSNISTIVQQLLPAASSASGQ